MWPVVAEAETSRVVPPPFSYYFGPMWSPEAVNKSPTSWLADAQVFYVAVLQELLRAHPSVEFELNSAITDVRVFDWWNFGQKAEKRFHIQPRYSAQLRDLNQTDQDVLLAAMRKWRRIEVRRARASGEFEITNEVPMSFFLVNRARTLASQGLVQDSAEAAMIPKFEELVTRKMAFPIGVIERATGDLVAANLALDGPLEANLLLSVLSPSHRTSGVGPLATFEAILAAKDRGKTVFDFNGANSPQRGDDKHSYGAPPVLYFSLSFAT